MRWRIEKFPAIRDGTSAKDRVVIRGKKAEESFKQGFRLKHHMAMWSMGNNVRNTSSYEWINPNMLEQFCKDLVISDRTKKLEPEELKKLESDIKIVFIRMYLKTIVEKFKVALPELAEYYVAKVACGALEKDRTLTSDNVEPASLADRTSPDYDTV